MYRSPKEDHFESGDYLIQQPYKKEVDERWYVQEISLLDAGRFDTWDQAYSHYRFMTREEKDV